MSMGVRLVEPDIKYAEAFRAMVREYEESNDQDYYDLYKPALEDFAEYVQSLTDLANNVKIPAGWVPGSTFWLTGDSQKILGVIRIRHIALPVYGNIGYDIPPSQRGKGYGTLVLSLGLEKAKALNLGRVYLTCDDDNLASRKIIEKNGGIFLEMVTDEGQPVRKYYIDL